jgi:hypothetical protein
MPWNFSVCSQVRSGHRGERWKVKNSQVLESRHETRCREPRRKSNESNFYVFYDGFGGVKLCHYFEPC